MDIVIEDVKNHLERYKAFLPPNHLHLISQTTGEHIGIGVRTSSVPIGYMVVRIDSKQSQATIIALEVEKGYSGRGIEEVLLQTLERTLKEKSYRYLTYDTVVQEGEKPVRAFLPQSEGWEEGRFLSTIFIGSIQSLRGSRWLNEVRMPKNFQMAAWDSLTDMEMTAVQEGCDEWYPEKLSPWVEGHDINPQLSLVLKYKGEVIGWLMVKRAARNMVLFQSLFVREEFSRLGRGGLLLSEGLRAALANRAMEYAMFVVEHENTAMLQLINKHFSPYVIRRKYLVSFRKCLF